MKKISTAGAEKFGKMQVQRLTIGLARKLAALLHRLWVNGEVYKSFHSSNRGALLAAA